MDNTIKTGLAVSTLLILISLLTLQYNIFGTQTIIDVFIATALIINAAVLIKVFKK